MLFLVWEGLGGSVLFTECEVKHFPTGLLVATCLRDDTAGVLGGLYRHSESSLDF